MTTQLTKKNHFSAALRKARRAKGLAQEAFTLTSSRTYVSSLERGLKSPTLNKIEGLAEVLGVHPLSLIALAYLKEPTPADVLSTLEVTKAEMLAMLNAS